VRIHGRPFIVGEMQGSGRVFVAADDGTDMMLNFGRQLEMVRAGVLRSEGSYTALTTDVLINLKRDWGTFTSRERQEAQLRYAYCRVIHDLPAPFRDKSKAIIAAFNAMALPEGHSVDDIPTPRLARSWYLLWVTSGFDIRALVSNTSARGNRIQRHDQWVAEEIDRAIDEVYATQLKGSINQTLSRARELIRVRAAAEGLPLPTLSKHVIGRKAIENTLAKRGYWEVLSKREDRQEAQRLMRLKGAGPQAEYPLAEVEADHTIIDLMVKENGVVLGRPWLTILIDRFSRMIIGFSIAFTPPSWVSVMEALRHAVLPKDEDLKRWEAYEGVPFLFDYPCYGAPDALYVDRGPEFLSSSMAATEAALNMRVVPLPKASGDKKGKVESNFHRMNKSLFHKLDGTTMSNTQKRGRYKSAESAIYSLDDVRYLVTRWVVDHHNRTRHPGTGEIPAERWRKGMDEVGPKPAPDRDIIAPLVGIVIPRKLRDDGGRYNNLRWNSNAFRALRERIGPPFDVVIRIDPLDLRTAYVLDQETSPPAWIEGQLMAESKIERYTLRQYEHLKKAVDDAAVVDDDYELKLAQGAQHLWNFVEGRQNRAGVIPKPIADFIKDGTRAVEHIHGERNDATASAEPVGSHDLDAPIISPKPDPNGPYRDRLIRNPNPYPQKGEDGRYPGERAPAQADEPVPTGTVAPQPAADEPPTDTVYSGKRRR
jgi:putative transposase